VTWAVATAVVTAAAVFFSLWQVFVLVGPGRPAGFGSDARNAVGLATVYLGLLGPPIVAAVAVGRWAQWWRAVLACQAAGMASAACLFLLSPDRFGFELGLVMATGWAAAAAVCGGICAIRSAARRRA
jgi:hypothetical protein